MPAAYDPFAQSTWTAQGLIHFEGKDSPNIRATRFFAYDSIDSDSKFSIKSSNQLLSPVPSRKSSISLIGRGQVDFKAGKAYSIPVPDPNYRSAKLIQPITHSGVLKMDNARNLFVTFDSDFVGELEYSVGIDVTIGNLAFANPNPYLRPFLGAPKHSE